MTCETCKNQCDCKSSEAFTRLPKFGDTKGSEYEPDTMTDNEIVKALERLENTKDYLKEQYQEQVKKCPYPELKPIAKQTYEDNKKAFDIAIKAIEEINRLQAENERLKNCVKSEDEVRDIAKRTMEPLVKEITSEQIDIAVKQAKVEAYKECIEKVNNIINEIYNKHIFGSNDLFDEEKDAVINFSDDVTYALDNLLKELVGENNA